ncbi:MAG: hypothetical protein AAF447_19415 [Myxococcota bacterium]
MRPLTRLSFALLLGLGLAMALGALRAPAPAKADTTTLVFVNGRMTRVYFNDGDSFRLLDGPYASTSARLAGFNTLESFGPVHAWGSFHPYEIYVLAKEATWHARRGVWHCGTDERRDGYGRLLLDCPDLAMSQIGRGFAHAMQINDRPSNAAYLRAQRQAQQARRGIWAHGIPGFILTSLHSFDEDPRREWHYNRRVSTRDGHSESRRHRETYRECEWVCEDELVVPAAEVTAVARAIRSTPGVAEAAAEIADNLLLETIVDRYARTQEMPAWFDVEEAEGRYDFIELSDETKANARIVRDFLAEARARGDLSEPETVVGACHLYTSFRRRFGRGQAPCLRGHGARPRELAAATGGGR